jgi:hypothetical protein
MKKNTSVLTTSSNRHLRRYQRKLQTYQYLKSYAKNYRAKYPNPAKTQYSKQQIAFRKKFRRISK